MNNDNTILRLRGRLSEAQTDALAGALAPALAQALGGPEGAARRLRELLEALESRKAA